MLVHFCHSSGLAMANGTDAGTHILPGVAEVGGSPKPLGMVQLRFCQWQSASWTIL